MTIREFRLICLQEVLDAVDEVELALDEFDEDTEVSSKDEIHLKRCTQNAINALGTLKAWIDDLD